MQRPSEQTHQLTPHYTYTNLADDLALVLTTGPQAHARLAELPEPWPEDQLATPPKPPHPIFDHIDDPEPEENMGQWIERTAREQRVPFEPMREEAIRRVKAKEFATQGAIAKAYHKPDKWARELRVVAVKQNVFKNEAEWWSCFPRRLKNGSTKPSTYDPQLTARKPAGVGGTPQLSRATFEKVMQEQRKLDFDTVIQMIRFRCWATTHDICEHFHQTPAWAASLRAFAIREGLFTAESWVKCFGRDRRPASQPQSGS